MRERRRFFGICLLLFSSALPLSSSGRDREQPLSWDIKMSLDVRGEYRIDTREAKYTGTYAFAFDWTGTMEKDDEDYLLVHKGCDLTRWEMVEKAVFADSVSVLVTREIPDKPGLKVNYILKKAGNLHFDFVVEGFEVPENVSSESFAVVFPASEENAGFPGEVNYDSFIQTGSNRVAISEKEILHGPVEQAFSWTWKYTTWIQKPESMVYQSNSHDAKVRIMITPEDGTYRKRVATSRG
jgi:hypothetical protein